MSGKSPPNRLQWGHGPKTVERVRIEKILEAFCFDGELQWGHGPKTVERRGLHHQRDGSAGASMGPRPEDRGE